MSSADRHNPEGAAVATGGNVAAALLPRGPVVVDVPSNTSRSAGASGSGRQPVSRLVVASPLLVDAARVSRMLTRIGVAGALQKPADAASDEPRVMATRITDWQAAEGVVRETSDRGGDRVLCVVRDGREVIARQIVCRVRRSDCADLPERVGKEIARAHTYHVQGRGNPMPWAGEESIRFLTTRWIQGVGACERVRERLGPSVCRLVAAEMILGPMAVSAADIAWCGAEPQAVARMEALRTPATAVWRRVFDENARSIFGSMAGELLVELGYELPAVKGRPTEGVQQHA